MTYEKKLKVAACVKQVPASQEAKMDPQSGTLIRSQDDNKLNPYDLYAIQAAIDIAKAAGGSSAALSMGPESAKEALLEAAYMGVGEAYLLTGREFAGADCYATAYALSEAIKAIGGFDIVICGKQTTDGDTAQVGAELSVFLGAAYEANALSIEISDDLKEAAVKSDKGDYIAETVLALPALISVSENINVPGLPSYRRKKAFTPDLVKVLGLKDLQDQNPANYGLSGSKTRVVRIFAPQGGEGHEKADGSPEELANALYSRLADRRFV